MAGEATKQEQTSNQNVAGETQTVNFTFDDDTTTTENVTNVVKEAEGETSSTSNAGEGGETSHDAGEGGETSQKQTPTKEEQMEYAFKRKQRQLAEEQEKARKIEQELSEARQKLAQYETPQRPKIDALPDTYDPDYEAKIKLRDEQIKAVAEFDAQQAVRIQQKQAQEQAQREAHIRNVQAQQQAYANRVDVLKLDKEEMIKNERLLMSYITPQNAQVGQYILEHEKGPLIVKYLGERPLELETLSGKNSLAAVEHIISNVLPNLAKTGEGKLPTTPEPTQTFSGKGAGSSEHPALKGVTFE